MLISGYRKGLFKVLDAVCILAALSITGWFMLPADLSVLDDYTGASLFTVVSYLFFFYVLDAYNVGAEDFKDTTGRVLIAFFLGAIASASAFYAFQHWRFDRRTLLLLFSLCLLFCLGWRALYYKHIGRFVHKARILLIGTDRAGKVRQTISESLTDADIVGYVGDCDNDREIPYLGTPMQVEEIAKQQNVTMIVLLPDAPIDEDIATELLHAKLHGQMIVDVRSFCEHMVHRLPVSQISSEWLLTEEGFSLNTRGSLRRLKRAFDLFATLGLLICTSPIMLLTAIAIRVESPGPVIYRQRRVGLFGQDFTVYKFRSMRTDAEKNGAVWAMKSDPRVTKVGKIIRKTRIDELPQLWNVLKGEMSLIGPRPERPEFVKELEKEIPFYSPAPRGQAPASPAGLRCVTLTAPPSRIPAASWSMTCTTPKTCPSCWTSGSSSRPSEWCSSPRVRANPSPSLVRKKAYRKKRYAFFVFSAHSNASTPPIPHLS